MKARKTILFIPLNALGHINPLMGIADRLKEDYGYRTVFLLLGKTTVTSIEDHGHELVIIEEKDQNGNKDLFNGKKDMFIDLNGNTEYTKNGNDLEENGKYTSGTKYNEAINNMHQEMRLEPVEAYIKIVKGKAIFSTVIKDQWANNHDSYVAALDSIKPDLVIIDYWFVAPCILGLKNTPWVYVCSANPYTFTKSKLPGGLKPPRMVGSRLLKNKEARDKLRNEEPDKWQALMSEWVNAACRIEQAGLVKHERFEKLMREYGFEPKEPGVDGNQSPFLNLYLYPKEIDYDQETDLFEYHPRWFRCDNLIRQSIGQNDSSGPWTEKLQQAMKGKTEIIYFSLGTIASGDLDLMNSFLNIFKEDTKRLYVVSKGIHGDTFELNSSNMIGDKYIPQTFFLQRCNLAIVHGGNNTTIECLYHGVPMIVTPCFEDQQDNAQRIEDLELGKKLRIVDVTKDKLTKAINEVLSNESLIKRVREIGIAMRSRDDLRKVSLILKELTDSGNLKQSFIDECRDISADEIQALISQRPSEYEFQSIKN